MADSTTPALAAAAAPTAAASSDAHNPQQPMVRSLVPPSGRHKHRPGRLLRLFRALCRTLPIFTPKCRIKSSSSSSSIIPTSFCASSSPLPDPHRRDPHSLLTGTLFGCRKGRVSFSLQENAGCLPSVVIELPVQTQALLREMSAGMVRIALECDKKPQEYARDRHVSQKLLDEPLWAMFCNGKKSGYGVRREATGEDLAVMETLRAVSAGAGVLPGMLQTEGPDGEMAYVRSGFSHVIGSRDSETLYMINPDEGNGPDLTIFFVRL